jgi:hypothetical protein
MKEAVGGLGITQIVIFFLILFSGYLCLSINLNKAYKVKDQIVSIIEKNNGLDANALAQIQSYMTTVGYRSTGTCSTDDGDGYSASGTSTTNDKALFCAKKSKNDSDLTTSKPGDTSKQLPLAYFYKIKVFFSIDVPIIGNGFGFNLYGTTRKLFYPSTLDK